ncbi:P-loop NTPase [Oligella urethralis]|uniref:P-loop NTPase n=1 Tax=Oligella urethralis TaxID=90245 RepID=UPI0021555DC2|nr:P-loop NTPase [Oligella urethralis]
MKQIHFVLQGKGGVGKSFVASLLAQYLKSTGNEVHCYDTVPVNQTFSRYKKLKVEIVKILTEHGICQDSCHSYINFKLLFLL